MRYYITIKIGKQHYLQCYTSINTYMNWNMFNDIDGQESYRHASRV
jgi:hypothetical protein